MTYILTLFWCLWTPQQPMSCDQPTSFNRMCYADTLTFTDTCALNAVIRQIEHERLTLYMDGCNAKTLVNFTIDTVQP